jgi:hypothetical protein
VPEYAYSFAVRADAFRAAYAISEAAAADRATVVSAIRARDRESGRRGLCRGPRGGRPCFV